MTKDSADVAQALAVAARRMSVPRTVEEGLDAIVRTAVLALPGFDHAGISALDRHHGFETVSGTDQLVWELDSLQYDLAEGPCVDAAGGEPVVVAGNALHERRWPRFMAAAAERGLHAQIGVRLDVDGKTYGCLNLYATRPLTLDGRDVELAQLFGTHAAIALGRNRAEDQLSEAIATRKVIGQAIGIITQRYRITSDRAFQFLVRASQAGNIKLRDVAQDVVDSTDEMFRRGH
ncbi:GAF and ANTAR domain-containing protein [Aeromicrobium sp. 179-A 4D2 NHS]|uniref:GAF and ANTAR domain-containing protein n=1 Tax=Aeromicrobium sp. 179-A 4D2 NHS TaxID=3142375 RepID=UPI00399F3719